MPLDESGLKFIEQMEGFSPTPYKCQAGVWTIGFGHTSGVGPKTLPETREGAEVELLLELGRFESELAKLVSIPLEPCEFTALLSFVLNEGITKFKKSTLLQKVNNGDILGASKEFSRWCYYMDPDTKSMVVSSGLATRRAKEAALFVSSQLAKKESVSEC